MAKLEFDQGAGGDDYYVVKGTESESTWISVVGKNGTLSVRLIVNRLRRGPATVIIEAYQRGAEMGLPLGRMELDLPKRRARV